MATRPPTHPPTNLAIAPQVLDWDARIFMIHDFLTAEECDHIRKVSEARMTRSGVVESDTGGSGISEIRTSFGVFLDRGEDEVVKGGRPRCRCCSIALAGSCS
jgi:prolyl 4-hydroxylase